MNGVVLMQVPKTALKTPFQQGTVQDVAKKMLQLSRDGLARRGKHEETFLDPLQEIADVCLLRTAALSSSECLHFDAAAPASKKHCVCLSGCLLSCAGGWQNAAQ